MENNKSTRIAPDFCSGSRRSGRCILDVFACRNNAEAGQKDKQDCGIYFFHWPYNFSASMGKTGWGSNIFTGTTPTYAQQMTIIATAVLASTVTAGVPGAEAIIKAITLSTNTVYGS